jgi:hypothetical protein
MKSWTTCFIGALALAASGALWLGLTAPPRPHEPMAGASARGESSALAQVGEEMVPPK